MKVQVINCVTLTLRADSNDAIWYHCACKGSHAGMVVTECYKDDDESQWKSLKFDPRHPKTPEPMATKIGRDDYVQDIYFCAKLHFDPVRGFCRPHMRSCLPNVHSARFFLPTSRFWRSMRQKTSFGARMCLLGVPKTIFYTFWPHFRQKTQVLVDFRRDLDSGQNGL